MKILVLIFLSLSLYAQGFDTKCIDGYIYIVVVNTKGDITSMTQKFEQLGGHTIEIKTARGTYMQEYVPPYMSPLTCTPNIKNTK